MTAKGLWKTASQAMARLLLGRKHVGTDRIGNEYFVEGEKRMVDYNGRLPDPRSIPYQWNRWLRRQRRDTPSEAEITHEEQAKLDKQRRVEEIQRIEQSKKEAEGDVIFIKGRPFTSIEHLIESMGNERRTPPNSSES